MSLEDDRGEEEDDDVFFDSAVGTGATTCDCVCGAVLEVLYDEEE